MGAENKHLQHKQEKKRESTACSYRTWRPRYASKRCQTSVRLSATEARQLAAGDRRCGIPADPKVFDV